MNAQTKRKALFSGAAGVALILANLVGCGDGDDNGSPSDQPTVTGGAGNVGGSSSSGGKSSSKGGSDNSGGENGNVSGGTNGTDGGSSNNSNGGAGNDGSGGGGASGPVPQDCEPEETADDCWTCPAETEQFLNQCNSAQCEHFDNEGRLPHLNEDGSLPDLP